MDSMDRLECDGCDNVILTVDGQAMLQALKGPCPLCGGTYQPAGTSSVDMEDVMGASQATGESP